MKDRRLHLGRRAERAGRDTERDARVAVELAQNRQAPVRLAARRRRHALGDLALEHERHLVDRRAGGDQRGQDRLPHAVRQVADDEHAPVPGARERAVVPHTRVGLDDLDRRDAGAQPLDEPAIDLEGDDASGGAGPVARRAAPGRRRLVGDDHDETVHGRGVPALDDQGRVEDDDAGETAAGELLEPPGEPLADPRVGDRLEALALLGNGEDDDAELRPVERPVALEDPPPELGDDVVVGGLAGRDHLAREHVGVDDHAPETTEDLGNGGFAGRDAPGQSHEQKLPGHTSAQSGPAFTSTTTGTWSGSAASMISRASASTAPISSGGASKRSSSWTCSSIRARSPRATSAACTRTIAILIMSLAVPWTGAFIAMRSAALRATRLPLARSGR